MKPLTILVCGGRDYADREAAFAALDRLQRNSPDPICKVIEGGQEGGDRIGREWAIARDIEFQTVEANWTLLSNYAGNARNTRMANLMPHIVVAFPGGVGTRDMIAKAHERKIRVWQPYR